MLVADAHGRISGSFMIPAGVPVGTRRVDFRGSGGSFGSAQYTGYGWRDIEIRQQIVTTVHQWIDPLAQIFTVPQDRLISAVDLWPVRFGDKNKPIIVQIRTTQVGIPTNEVLAETRLSGANLVANQWLTFRFSELVFLRSDQVYALVVMTDDGYHEVAVAKIGGFDQRTGWVRSQAYSEGTLLSGADARTWLPHPELDLTFRLRAARFTKTEHTIDLGKLSVERISDILPVIMSLRPEGTEIEVEITTPNGQRYTIAPGANVELPAYMTGDVSFSIKLRGTATLSPVLLQKSIQVVLGTIAEECDYVSRAISAGTNMKVRVVADSLLPSGSSLKTEVQTGENSGSPVWNEVSLKGATSLGDGVKELEYVYAPLNNHITRFKLTLKGGPAVRAWLRGLRGSVTPNA